MRAHSVQPAAIRRRIETVVARVEKAADAPDMRAFYIAAQHARAVLDGSLAGEALVGDYERLAEATVRVRLRYDATCVLLQFLWRLKR